SSAQGGLRTASATGLSVVITRVMPKADAVRTKNRVSLTKRLPGMATIAQAKRMNMAMRPAATTRNARSTSGRPLPPRAASATLATMRIEIYSLLGDRFLPDQRGPDGGPGRSLAARRPIGEGHPGRKGVMTMKLILA